MPETSRVGSSVRLRLGTFLVELGDSRMRIVVASATLGACTGAVEYIVHEAFRYSQLAESLGAFMDAFVVGLAASAVATIWLYAARERRKRVLHEMGKVAELNHNVRNALQVIAHSHAGPPDAHAEMVLESVERIERTLRQLFPGVERSEQLKQPHVFIPDRRQRTR